MPLPIPSATLDALGPWLALAAFGAYHGLNPGMGWLFALALGLQQRSERAILLSLVPIALGHALSLALVAAVLWIARAFISTQLLGVVTAGLLLAFGIYKLFTYYRHPRWVGMRVNLRELALWSFLMATAHGAGLMIAPLLLGVAATPVHSAEHGEHAEHMAQAAAESGGAVTAGVWTVGIGIHTLVMLLVMVVVALFVYRKLGLAVLRRGWINFDLIWAVALLVVGAFSLFAAL